MVELVLEINMEKPDSAKKENLVLTYHEACKKVTCICGVMIQGCHSCSIAESGQGMVSGIVFRVCRWERRKRAKGQSDQEEECQVCLKEENFQKYLDSTYNDRDGYEYCSFCNEHSHCCSCVAFINRDGEEKCKRCNAIWDGLDLESGKCDACGYEGAD